MFLGPGTVSECNAIFQFSTGLNAPLRDDAFKNSANFQVAFEDKYDSLSETCLISSLKPLVCMS